MVFCRGCGKEIHETAPVCPLCGALQAGPPAVASKRNVAKLVGWVVVWTIVFWIGALFLTGAIAGMLNPLDARAAGGRAGEALSAPILLVSLCISIGLTVFGELPGTGKSKSSGSRA